MSRSNAMAQEINQGHSGRLTLTVDEVAEILGIARHSAYRACHQGELPVIRVGKRFLIPKAALDRMLTEAGKDGDQS